MKNIRVIQWGLGAMGSGMAKLALTKEGIDIVGAIDTDPDKAGKDLGDVLNMDKKLGVNVKGNAEDVIGKVEADLVIIATSSFVNEVYPQITLAVVNKLNVITIAEEMSFPAAVEPELTKKMDDLAQQNGVTILGTGVNPGFILDSLIIFLTGGCSEVKKIRAARINDLSPFGPTVMRTQGVGTTPEEFAAGLKDGSIVGHIGFLESIGMIADALGWKIDKIEENREPIISNVYRETAYVKVQPGMVAGCRHTAKAYMDGEVVIELEHPQQVLPHLEGVETGDYIWIEGVPNFNVSNKPECPGGIGTISTAVNMIPHVINAEAGLTYMHKLPVVHALMGDVRNLLK